MRTWSRALTTGDIVGSYYAKVERKRKEKALAKARRADELQQREQEIKCGRKKIFRTETRARATGLHQQAMMLYNKLYVYACEKCGGWHLTHRPQKPEQAVDYKPEAA